MEQYLLDTNILLWMLSDSSKISEKVKKILESDADLYYSDVSLWEIAIKINIGKLELKISIPELEAECQKLGLDRLPIRSEYFECLRTLPLIHHDPFDRLLISQAKVDELVFLSADRIIPSYGIRVIG